MQQNPEESYRGGKTSARGSSLKKGRATNVTEEYDEEDQNVMLLENTKVRKIIGGGFL